MCPDGPGCGRDRRRAEKTPSISVGPLGPIEGLAVRLLVHALAVIAIGGALVSSAGATLMNFDYLPDGGPLEPF